MKKLNFNDYQESYVAFIDILGFTDKINRISTEEDFDEIGNFLLAIKKTASNFTKDKKFLNHFQVTAISDSIILSVPMNKHPYCLITLIMLLHSFQYDLLLREYLIRGHISKGLIYHKQEIIFGKGYIDAYNVESKLKGPPRITIDPLIIKDGMEFIATKSESPGPKLDSFLDFLKIDPSDGQYFIDFLNKEKNIIEQNKYDLDEESERIKLFINTQIDTHFDNIYISRKYHWLRWYYQEHINKSERL